MGIAVLTGGGVANGFISPVGKFGGILISGVNGLALPSIAIGEGRAAPSVALGEGWALSSIAIGEEGGVFTGLSPKDEPRSGTLNDGGVPLGFGGVGVPGDDGEDGGVFDPETGGFISSMLTQATPIYEYHANVTNN